MLPLVSPPPHQAKEVEESDGISCEVIDLQTLLPWDIPAVEASVNKTGRCGTCTRREGMAGSLLGLRDVARRGHRMLSGKSGLGFALGAIGRASSSRLPEAPPSPC